MDGGRARWICLIEDKQRYTEASEINVHAGGQQADRTKRSMF